MNINLIRENKNLISAEECGQFILETYLEGKQDRSMLRLILFDPADNSRKEIAPSIKKYERLPVINCIWQSEDVFFASVSVENDNALALYRYSIQDDKTDRVAVLGDILSPMQHCDRIKIFVLDRSLFLIQVEMLEIRDIETGKGKLTFRQKLVNTDTGEEVAAADPNLVNNGVDVLKALSPTHIMMKTGYSYLEDERLRPGVAEEALIESVYYGTISQFVTSIGMETSTTGYTMLGTAYHEKNIFGLGTGGDYIYFSIMEPQASSSETIYYNYKTDETLRAHSIEIDESNSVAAFVAYDIPFISQNLSDSIELINIRTSMTDSLFFEEGISGVLGNLVILHSRKRHHEYIRGYMFPKLELNFEQKGRYITGCIKDKEYYVYYHS